MGECKLDHSLEDVKKKLEQQQSFLPVSLVQKCEAFLEQEPTQLQLNELFHLLKKYDLATKVEQQERNKAIEQL
ncbi:group-specific protein [Bacillus alkalicellulosilyticus]|uniref:group-specific protein n=1 Tax=Alkalihalobacterium alkalicellulosilyticum TaxID=1912214 RepID=UPI000998D738|nr:group-specific protein [Bacillus alkalicellulosilyticus]